jgi:hypothetical protein
MKFEDFAGMPSGTDYGTVLNWSLLDGDDFTVAFFAKGNPFGDIKDDEFTWVVEAKSGQVVYISKEVPLHRPIFGLDALEWSEFKQRVLPIVDKYIEDATKSVRH